MQELIRLEKICRNYPAQDSTVHALQQVSLSIGSGEFSAITGHSGSGKSTLMNILGCLDRPTSGTYYLDGQDVFALSDRERTALRGQKLGFIFQGYNLISTLTCLENVELPLLYAGLPPKLRQERVLEALEQVGLSDRLHHRPCQLSGGQQQRTAIARAIASCPQCLLADEPTGNLDPETTSSIMELLFSLNRQGKTIVLITHDPSIAAAIPRVIGIDSGKIAFDRRKKTDPDASQ